VEFQEVADLERWLKSHMSEFVAVIAVDGAPGAGKSTLACNLANAIGVSEPLHLDDYLPEEPDEAGRHYGELIDQDALRRDLQSRHAADDRAVIIEGVCILDVLERIGSTPDLLIYLKRVDSDGLWPDEWLCDPSLIDADHPLLAQRGAPLDRMIVSYHLKFDPLSRAQVVFLRRMP
jgi:hypothetical protein